MHFALHKKRTYAQLFVQFLCTALYISAYSACAVNLNNTQRALPFEGPEQDVGRAMAGLGMMLA